MNNFLKPREGISGSNGYFSPQIDASVRLNANEAPEALSEEFITGSIIVGNFC